MLWLAGLMGLMAVGTVTFVTPVSHDEDEFASTSNTRAIDPGAHADDFPDEEILDAELGIDPRGGDDAAILPPLVLTAADRVLVTDGTDGADDMIGDTGNDRLFSGAGDDTVEGAGGNDELRGGAGDDLLLGSDGADTLHGEDGADTLNGGAGDDALFGHNSGDTLQGGAGNDALQGSSGEDILDGGDGDDVMQGGLDNDTLHGGMGADTLFGGWGDDVIDGRVVGSGGDGDAGDFLNGGGGDDVIVAGAGDMVTAGTGTDAVVLGDWITDGNAAQITDYVVEDDSIVLIWDDSGADSEVPQVGLSDDSETANRTLVLLNGVVVATVNGTDLMPGDIALVPLSAAAQLGFGPAL